MKKKPEIHRFIGLVLVLLIPSFVIWMAITPWLAGPIVVLCDAVLSAWMPDIVAEVQLKESAAFVLTNYGELDGVLVSASRAGNQLGFPTDVRLLSYSIPFYAALHFAMGRTSTLEGFSWGVLLLYPVAALGVICVSVKNLMVGLGAPFFSQSASFIPDANLIAILYQLNTLIIPPLAPILVWAWQSRDSELLTQFSVLQKKTAAEN